MRPTLYEFAGGAKAFGPFAAALHARCLADPELNHPFSHPGQNPLHVERLAAYLAEAMGGPPRYSGEYGGDQTALGDRASRSKISRRVGSASAVSAAPWLVMTYRKLQLTDTRVKTRRAVGTRWRELPQVAAGRP